MDDRAASRRVAGDLSALPFSARLLGLDPSRTRLGVAISDGMRASALPVCVIRRTRFAEDMRALQTLIEDHAIGGMVIGLPLRMDGQEGRRAQSVRDFAKALCETINLPLAFWDERLTTQAAKRDVGHSKKAAQMTDALAAAHILQAALDKLNRLQHDDPSF